MTARTKTVIHRDQTFEYNGRRYAVLDGGRGWGYQILTHPDLKHVADGFFTLAEIREHVDRARREGRKSLA